jgi:hypothetical protein
LHGLGEFCVNIERNGLVVKLGHVSPDSALDGGGEFPFGRGLRFHDEAVEE